MTRTLEPTLAYSIDGKLIPGNIRNILARDLEMCGGKDWYHFVLALGDGMKERDDVRIKPGEEIAGLNNYYL